jgi:hypothetical protein
MTKDGLGRNGLAMIFKINDLLEKEYLSLELL